MTLKLHHLRPAPGAKTAKTRVGRGEGSKGKTAGRGTKGTKARYQVPAGFEGGQMPLHMRLPKLKGFKNPFKVEFQVVNLDRIERRCSRRVAPSASRTWSPRAPSAPAQPVKVLGSGRHLRRRAGERARVLRLGQGEDRGCRRQHHRALTAQLSPEPAPGRGSNETAAAAFDRQPPAVRAPVRLPGSSPLERGTPRT